MPSSIMSRTCESYRRPTHKQCLAPSCQEHASHTDDLHTNNAQLHHVKDMRVIQTTCTQTMPSSIMSRTCESYRRPTHKQCLAPSCQGHASHTDDLHTNNAQLHHVKDMRVIQTTCTQTMPSSIMSRTCESYRRPAHKQCPAPSCQGNASQTDELHTNNAACSVNKELKRLSLEYIKYNTCYHKIMLYSILLSA